MNDVLEKLQLLVANGSELFKEIKPKWSALGFPGSVYSPNEFIISFLLSFIGGDINDLVALKEKIEIGKAARKIMVDSQVIRAHAGSEELSVIFIAALAQALKQPVSEMINQAVKVSKPIAPVAAEKLIVLCPHCGHDPEECRKGKYLVEEQKAAPVFMEEKHVSHVSAAEEVTESEHEFCCHVDNTGKCTRCTEEKVVDCDACNEEIIESRGHKCKNEDCQNIYCDSCKEEHLNEAGYCDDCATTECDHCQQDTDTEKLVRCANPKCKSNIDLCGDCAAKYFNEDGLCPSCSGEKDMTCHGCQCDVTESRAIKCKGYDSCDNVFCPDCKGELNDAGYCEECREAECSFCSDTFPREEGVHCANPECRDHDDIICPNCAKSRLNEEGFCATCSKENEVDCSDCGETFVESRTQKCCGKDCDNFYCPNCAESNLNSRGKCSDCA